MSTDPAFDISRISDYPDKLLLSRISDYFIAFANGDFDGMDDMESDDFHITDVAHELVRAPKSDWYQANRGFTSLVSDVRVQAISIDGSSSPGSFAIMENAVWSTLAVDPPEEAKKLLPPGAQKGDTIGIVTLTTLWWNEEGRVFRDLEYGRWVWDGFDIDAFKTW